jgi:hypothetical protein
MSGSQRRATGPWRRRSAVNLTQSELLRRALGWAINEGMFAKLPLHGNTGWRPGQLVILAVLWVWSGNSTLTGAFDEACHLSVQMIGQAAVTSYQGLTAALVTWTPHLLPRLWSRLQMLMQEAGGSHWRVGPWLALAVDGSRVNTPRTQSNEQAFAAKHYGKGSKARSRVKWRNKRRRSKRLAQPVKPQIWLTLIWHIGLKMPWCWKTGPSTSNECHHFLELLKSQKFPEKTLFCCDAGFVGYQLWKALVDHGHDLLIRVGGNVRLLRELGHARCGRGLVYLWPNAAARKGQRPLVLRLLEFQGPRGRVYLVTNVLSERELTVRQASELYKRRWGVELQFRAFKQTFGRRNLRSRTASRALAEMEWSLVGLWIVQLFAVKEQIKADRPPENSSVALALLAIQNAMRNWNTQATSQRQLRLRLRDAVKDGYQRTSSKQARYKRNYKDKPSATQPIVITATAKQKRAYRKLKMSA